MAQIIPQSSFASGLASSLGQGLGEGLQQLAQHKLMQLHTQKERAHVGHGLSALGFTPEQSQQLAGLPPALLGPIIKNYLAAAENSGLEEALGALSGQPTQQMSQQMVENQPQEDNLTTPLAREAAAKIREPQQQQQKSSLKDILQRPRLNPQQKIKLAEMEQRRELNEKKLQAAERKETNAQQAKIDKETKPFYDEIAKGAKSALESNKRLDRMEELISKGNLTNPVWASLIKTASKGIFGLGLDLGFLTSADSQEFDKLSTDFLKNAKDIFGSRITDADMSAFLKTVPSLTQSDAGKKRVIENLRSFNQAALIKKNAANAIIKENGGKRPANFDALVDERVAPQLDALATKFKEGSDKEEPQDPALFRGIRALIPGL